MSLSGISTSLLVFKTKIDEAVGLVPEMGAEDKLKAVQFWNMVSEKLQEIVNNSAADISALAMKMEKQDTKDKTADQQKALNKTPASFNNAVAKQKEVVTTDQTKKLPPVSSNQETLEVFVTSAPSSFTASTTNFSGPSQPIVDKQVISNSSIPEAQIEYLSNQAAPLHTACSMPPTSNTNIATESVPSQRPLEDNLKSNLSLNLDTLSQVPAASIEASIATEQRMVVPGIQQEIASSILETLLIDPNAKITELNTRVGGANAAAEQKKALHNNRKSPLRARSMSPEPSMNDQALNSSSQSEANDEEAEDSQEMTNEDEIDGSDDEDEALSDTKEQVSSEVPKESEKNGLLKVPNKMDGVIIPKKGSGKKSKGSLTCEWCFKEFPNSSALTGHRWVHTKPYTCSNCDACFSTRGNLVVHQRRHTGEKPFACTLCDARFSTKGNLKRHIKTHSGAKPWTCSQCGGRFTEKKSLKVHMRRHTGEKPYECKICGKRFSQTGILQTHMAMHLDEKSHLCEHCGKSFRQKSQLRLHMMRHKGVRNHVCTSCPAKFLTKGDLERHNRIHTGERPYVCELCGKTFTRQQSLNEHMNRHYGLKPYTCKYCGKVFAEMSACYKHVKQHEKSKNSSTDSSQKAVQADKELKIPVSCGSTSEGIQLSGASDVDQIVEVQHTNFGDADAHKFTVLVHTDQPLEVASEMTVVQDEVETILPNEESITLTVPNHITDFAAISLLASASTYQ